MTSNKGPDSDLIFSLGIIFADGLALLLIAAMRSRKEAATSPASPTSAELSLTREYGAETKAPALGLCWCKRDTNSEHRNLWTSALMIQDFMKRNRQEALNRNLQEADGGCNADSSGKHLLGDYQGLCETVAASI